MVVGLRLRYGALVVACRPDDAALLAGQEEVLEKIGGQFCPTAEPGLLVDGRGMLARGALAAAGRLGRRACGCARLDGYLLLHVGLRHPSDTHEIAADPVVCRIQRAASTRQTRRVPQPENTQIGR